METVRTGPSGESAEIPRYRALGSTSRVTILRLVRQAGDGRTAGELAGLTGLHLSTARAHADRLVAAGLLVKERASGGTPGRPAWRYRPAAPVPAPAPYRALATALLDHLGDGGSDVPAAAVRAGARWGARLVPPGAQATDPVAAVVTVLDGLGFAPRATEGAIHLHTCPFLELVGSNPDAMCPLHLGVVRGVLDRVGAPDTTADLEPFGAPDACVVRLSGPDDRAAAA